MVEVCKVGFEGKEGSFPPPLLSLCDGVFILGNRQRGQYAVQLRQQLSCPVLFFISSL